MTTRRAFVATAAAAFATRYTRWLPGGDRLPLGFSTLGCPAWTWPQILDFAAAHGYVAVELRGLQTTMDLSQAPELAPGRLEEARSEEHTSELQSPCNLVCRLLLEKKNKSTYPSTLHTPSDASA